MKIKLLAVGTKMPDWVNSAFNEYCKRLPKDFSIELVEIPAAKRTKNQLAKQWMEKEGESILKNIDKNDHVIALEVKGQNWSTEVLADKLIDIQNKGNNLVFIIGGPDGLAPDCLKRANLLWSLSALTMPHPIVRIIFAEAIYRAWTVTVNHPYHRE